MHQSNHLKQFRNTMHLYINLSWNCSTFCPSALLSTRCISQYMLVYLQRLPNWGTCKNWIDSTRSPKKESYAIFCGQIQLTMITMLGRPTKWDLARITTVPSRQVGFWTWIMSNWLLEGTRSKWKDSNTNRENNQKRRRKIWHWLSFQHRITVILTRTKEPFFRST